MIVPEKDSDETYAMISLEENTTPFTRKDENLYMTSVEIGSETGFQFAHVFGSTAEYTKSSFEILYKQNSAHIYETYGAHYAEYKNHSNCGRRAGNFKARTFFSHFQNAGRQDATRDSITGDESSQTIPSPSIVC